MNNNISLNYDDILKLIPHRYPFLMIDKVENLEVNKKAVGIKMVSINEEYFKGHFPEYPVMPGVLIVEAMAQTAACLISYSNKDYQGKKVVFLTGVNEAKFKKPILPGNVVYLEVSFLNSRKNFFKFSGKAIVKNQVMAIANFSAMLTV